VNTEHSGSAAAARFREQQQLPGPLRFLRLDVVVDGERLHVRLSSVLAPFSRQVTLDDVVDVEVHDQLSRHVPGVWGRFWVIGVRMVPGVGTMYNLTATRGVTLRIRDGRRLVIGSDRPEQLAAAVQSDAPN